MKLFLDSADLVLLKKWQKTSLIDGITTNPTNLSQVGGDPEEIIKEICALFPNGEISVEVTERDPQKVYEQAKRIASLSKNVLVKIPCHQDYYVIIKQLVQEGVLLNITLVFTLVQALFMCKLGVRYISPFVGRWDDIDVEGADILYEMRTAIDRYGYKTGILAASLRSVRHVHEAMLAGVDAITMPPAIMEKASAHVLTDAGIDIFIADWAKVGRKDFP
jgi:transaldolase